MGRGGGAAAAETPGRVVASAVGGKGGVLCCSRKSEHEVTSQGSNAPACVCMRAPAQAMVSAEVGDDVWGDDPTVNALQSAAARLFGLEAGLFCPSGTMTNQIAIKVSAPACGKWGPAHRG